MALPKLKPSQRKVTAINNKFLTITRVVENIKLSSHSVTVGGDLDINFISLLLIPSLEIAS